MKQTTSFALALKQRRKVLDMTQQELARQVGCAPVTIQRIEQGTLRPSRRMAERLAAALELSAEEHEQFARLARPDSASDPLQSQAQPSAPFARLVLPIPPTPLIGRGPEVAAVRAALAGSSLRLLTLTGPGGAGKTRLALQVAAEIQSSFADGVRFVDLAPINDPQLVIPTIMHTLGVKEEGQLTPLEQLHAHLHDKQMLLLLDNLEQVVDAAPSVAELLLFAPQLKVLVTSRVALRLRGEQEFPVLPLALPPQELRQPAPVLGRVPSGQFSVPISVEALTEYAAVQLFVARAQAVRPDFQLTDANAPAVAEICARLDGLPLAIELAATRIKLFAPAELLKRLERSLGVLVGGPRDVPARQQTLRNTIDWSYRLLDDGEQTLFRRLGVFVGGYTIEAAEAICGGWGLGDEGWDDSTPTPILDGLQALIDHSLLQSAEELDGEARFTMLETIREYALEQLVAGDELEAARRRHALHYVALAHAAEPAMWGAQRKRWMDRLEQEYANLRAVIDWAGARGEIELGLQISSALWHVWDAQGMVTEGRAHLSALLARAQTGPPTLAHIKALRGAGLMAWDQGDVAAAHTFLEESLRLAQQLGDPSIIADALGYFGEITNQREDITSRRHLIEESLAIYRTLANHQGMWRALGLLAQLSAQQGDFASAWELGEQSLAIVQELEDSTGIAVVQITLGNIARFQGKYPLARSCYEQSLAHWRAVNDSYGIAQTCVDLAYVTLNEGDTDRAAELFRDSLVLNRRAERRRGMIPGLVGLAGVARVRQQPKRAARLVGAATALLEATRVTLDSTNRRDYDRIVADVQALLDKAACASAWTEGRAMPIVQAVAYALEPIPPVPLEPTTPAVPYPAGLTKREVEVLRLIAQGLTDAQIAERLVLSAHTVHAHLRSIYGKLNVTSRAAATRFAMEHSLL